MNIFRSFCISLVGLTLMCFMVIPESMKLYEDQEAKAKRFIANSLLEKHYILPSASAVELVYSLNPQLKNMKEIPDNYKLILPKTPTVTDILEKSFLLGFMQDNEYDGRLQQALQDTIRKCEQLLPGYMNIAAANPVRWDTSRRALLKCYAEMRSMDVNQINRGLCIQLMNLISGCIQTLERSVNKKKISQEDQSGIMELCYDLSYIFPTNRMRNFLDTMYPSGRPVSVTPQTAEEIGHALSGPAAGLFVLPVLPPPENGLRSFRISVQLRKDNKVISDGPDITGRYKVTFYPPALKQLPMLHLGCTGLATYSSISLSAAIYETKVLDLKTNRECRIIGSPVVDARSIFRKPGDNIYEIQIFLED